MLGEGIGVLLGALTLLDVKRWKLGGDHSNDLNEKSQEDSPKTQIYPKEGGVDQLYLTSSIPN